MSPQSISAWKEPIVEIKNLKSTKIVWRNRYECPKKQMIYIYLVKHYFQEIISVTFNKRIQDLLFTRTIP